MNKKVVAALYRHAKDTEAKLTEHERRLQDLAARFEMEKNSSLGRSANTALANEPDLTHTAKPSLAAPELDANSSYTLTQQMLKAIDPSLEKLVHLASDQSVTTQEMLRRMNDVCSAVYHHVANKSNKVTSTQPRFKGYRMIPMGRTTGADGARSAGGSGVGSSSDYPAPSTSASAHSSAPSPSALGNTANALAMQPSVSQP